MRDRITWMRIRILSFVLMRIRIRILPFRILPFTDQSRYYLSIDADPDMDPITHFSLVLDLDLASQNYADPQHC
jgi:hypothetical protein